MELDLSPLAAPVRLLATVATGAPVDGGQTHRDRRGNVVVYRLWNYGVDASAMEPEHEVSVSADVVPEALATSGPVAVVGHASTTGTAEHNRTLSVARASAVGRLLIDEGVAPERVSVMGFGESPRANDEAEDPFERAVRVVVVGVPAPVEPAPDGPGSVPRPPDAAIDHLVETDPIAEKYWYDAVMLTYVPDILNVLGPSSAGLGNFGRWVVVDLLKMADSTRDLLAAEHPDAPERLRRDRKKVLDWVWRDYTHTLGLQGRGFNPSYEVVDETGRVVDRPFAGREDLLQP